ncbi:SDR family NAD(P)-dependent oxidoreductase [Agromyces aerolatus]|uniref:SDR family NAD(P)-dependent oxidoreductase n=1 Tax=Agromyces sp. LY-1074 TaxID=3074080 RepID=UPI00285C3F19|nr:MULTISPECIES: SDR family NAD(P)-dependent oxidoreductase [unclassified Agromyces]MDR5698717.1 SDR family NAD(P)-dependent oxidoreductase [Agromyces sp. LY-1074]MDR5705011.1 SDR family NAD(P)-dependent oxidoreductase [Agromyces sp. LY-1358]
MAGSDKTILIVGGTSGIGLEIARDSIARGDRVVITGRDQARADEVAASLGPQATAVALDISEPSTIAGQLAPVGEVHGLVLAAIERDANTIRDYDIDRAIRLVTLKLVGYTETVHALLDRMEPSVETGIVLFGGRAKDLPYPGSTTVSSINGGVTGLVNTLALELAPIRVNALHPGIIGDSPFWANKPAEVLEGHERRTPGGALATMADVVDATQFLLRNRGVSAVNLYVDRASALT